MTDVELRKFFGFDEEDLIANRLGQLSQKQEAKLLKSAGQSRFWLFVIGAIVFLAFSSGPIWQLTHGAAFSIGAGILILLGVLIGGFFIINGVQNKSVPAIAKAEGNVNFVKVEKDAVKKDVHGHLKTVKVEQYELRVDKVNFENVDEELINLIVPGGTYIVYYDPNEKTILSVEFVSKGV